MKANIYIANRAFDLLHSELDRERAYSELHLQDHTRTEISTEVIPYQNNKSKPPQGSSRSQSPISFLNILSFSSRNTSLLEISNRRIFDRAYFIVYFFSNISNIDFSKIKDNLKLSAVFEDPNRFIPGKTNYFHV